MTSSAYHSATACCFKCSWHCDTHTHKHARTSAPCDALQNDVAGRQAAPTLLSHYLLRTAARKPDRSSQEALQPGLYALLDAVGSRELQLTYALMTGHSAARSALKSLHQRWEALHKFTGKV
jgi:hypothetical protein